MFLPCFCPYTASVLLVACLDLSTIKRASTVENYAGSLFCERVITLLSHCMNAPKVRIYLNSSLLILQLVLTKACLYLQNNISVLYVRFETSHGTICGDEGGNFSLPSPFSNIIVEIKEFRAPTGAFFVSKHLTRYKYNACQLYNPR